MNQHQEVDQFKILSILRSAKEFFAKQEQAQRFEIELSEIITECKTLKFDLDFILNRSQKWIEIEISIRQPGIIINAQSLETVVLSLQIGREYPVKDVRVVCKTTFVKPTLADGRNFLPDIILQSWNYKLQLMTIIKEMPDFINNIISHQDDKIYLQNLGQYYLGATYQISELKEFSDLSRFPIIQQSNAFFQNISVRLICLSDAHFYLFEVQDAKDDLRLIFRAPLQSCTELKRKKSNSSEITLTWRNYKTRQEEQQLFIINDYDQFIKQFLRRLNQYQNIKMASNSLSCFTDQQIHEKERIISIMQTLSQLEVEIDTKFNQQNISKLMGLYQQAIEFYSYASDYLYEIYLNKLQTLIQRQDVQVILQYK